MANDPIFADLLGEGWEPAAPMTTQLGIWLGKKVPETSSNTLRWQLQIPPGTDARQEARRIVQAFDSNRWAGVVVSCELNGGPYDYVAVSGDKDIAGGWTSLGISIYPDASTAEATAQMPVAADPEQRYPSNPATPPASTSPNRTHMLDADRRRLGRVMPRSREAIADKPAARGVALDRLCQPDSSDDKRLRRRRLYSLLAMSRAPSSPPSPTSLEPPPTRSRSRLPTPISTELAPPLGQRRCEAL